MKNNTLNHFFWENINYYFRCFKKRKDSRLNEDETDDLLGVQSIIMNNI